MNPGPIWIIDDDDAIRWVLDKALTRAGLPCRLFSDPLEALATAEHDPPRVVVTDVRMASLDGFSLIARLKAIVPDLIAIVMTAYSDLDAAVKAFQAGAYEYLSKPFDLNEAVALIRRAWQSAHPSPPSDLPSPLPSPEAELIGTSPAMQTLYRAIGRLAASNATVLILGETGTGKELVARALHRHSTRAANPFIAINTAAIPRELLEAELFGVEKGAYTGATATRPGRFEEAHGGTLFLDEIGDMPLELQTRLLRVLALGEFHRLGGRELKRVDVRIIAATHQDLAAKVASGAFRADLYHRLNVIRLELPPLRERREDIPLLAEHFLTRIAAQLGVPRKRLTPEALAALLCYPFPGNVRELENLCHWLTVMAPDTAIALTDLPPEFRRPPTALTERPEEPSSPPIPSAPLALASPSPSPSPLSSEDPHTSWEAALAAAVPKTLLAPPPPNGLSRYQALRERFDRVVLTAALTHTGGNQRRAAALLGVSRNTFTRKRF